MDKNDHLTELNLSSPQFYVYVKPCCKIIFGNFCLDDTLQNGKHVTFQSKLYGVRNTWKHTPIPDQKICSENPSISIARRSLLPVPSSVFNLSSLVHRGKRYITLSPISQIRILHKNSLIQHFSGISNQISLADSVRGVYTSVNQVASRTNCRGGSTLSCILSFPYSFFSQFVRSLHFCAYKS